MELGGKIVVVTGGAGGVGAAVARRFTAEGAQVVLTDVEGAAVDQVANGIGCEAIAGDTTDAAHVEAVARLATERHGGIAAERFLITNEPNATAPLAAKAADYEGWIDTMSSR